MNKKHILLFLGIILLDQLTKIVIGNAIGYQESVEIIKNFFSLTNVHNTGAAWSMLEGKMMFFYIISIISLVAMAYFYKTLPLNDKYTKLGLVLMMAGTVGNFIDRLYFQYVRDFLDVVIFGYDFPVFNIADSALCIGVGFILLDVFLESRGLKQ